MMTRAMWTGAGMSETPKKPRSGLSVQRLKARHNSAMTEQTLKGITIDTNFLLKCSDSELDAFQLARLAVAANLRSLLQETLDRYVETEAQCIVVNWFRRANREELRLALETDVDVIALAQEQIKKQGRSEQELQEELSYVLAFEPGKAHRTAAMRYQERNIAKGLCSVCPQLLARTSVRYCETHLTAARERARAKSKKLNKPPHGRAPGTLAALAEARTKAKP
jgi:hypothetical protein